MAVSGSGGSTDGGTSAAAIRAGAAFVELFARDASLFETVDHAESELKQFAVRSGQIGKRVRDSFHSGLGGKSLGIADSINTSAEAVGEVIATGIGRGLTAGRRSLNEIAVGTAMGAASTVAGVLAGPFPRLRSAVVGTSNAVGQFGADLVELESDLSLVGQTSSGLAATGLKRLASAVGVDLSPKLESIQSLFKGSTDALKLFAFATGAKPKPSFIAGIVAELAQGGLRSRLPEAATLFTALGKAAGPAADLLESAAKQIGGPVGESLKSFAVKARESSSWLTLIAKSAGGLDLALSAYEWVSGLPNAFQAAFGSAGLIAMAGIDAIGAGIATLFDNKILRSIHAVGGAFDWLGKRTAIAGAGIAAAGIAAFHVLDEMAATAMDRATALFNLTRRTGESAEGLSRIAFAAEQVGISFETTGGALEAWAERLSRAADSNDDTSRPHSVQPRWSAASCSSEPCLPTGTATRSGLHSATWASR